MNEEKLKVLEMIQEGKISAAEGMELLKAFDEGQDGEPYLGQRRAGSAPKDQAQDQETHGGATSSAAEHFLRVRVTGDKSNKVNVNIPFSLIKSASKLARYALAFIPAEARAEMEKKGLDPYDINIEELVRLLEQGTDGKLVDIETEDEYQGKVKVEVCVE
ncbi:SHOCT-like domain-containing protein [Acididesulfobacillus acetoxydans]|nr:hypothetical protein [Acididesulfobacillus acetoxydans]